MTEATESPKEVTVGSIRNDLRSDVMFLAMMSTGFSFENRSEQQKIAVSTASNLLKFGVNSGLLPLEEAEEWNVAVVKGQPFGDLMMKYCDDFPKGEEQPAPADS